MSGKKRDPKKNELAQKILDAYQPESVEDMQEALKDIFGPLFETMLKGEMNHHLGYDSNSKDAKPTDNRRNGYGVFVNLIIHHQVALIRDHYLSSNHFKVSCAL